ncbi:hypothetical protein FACS1894163_05440 [Spirochaetia bacterium]|nr:hypothetical protein FACS1894163_05440 [Spirochaetia bacterium]
MAIPKIIHYCWLSGGPIPEAYQRCMDTWKTKLPDYQFVLWNTQNFDINAASWTKQSFDAGLYAFASDYIRLYKEPGVKAAHNLHVFYVAQQRRRALGRPQILWQKISWFWEIRA